MAKLTKLLIAFVGLALVAFPAQAYEKGDWVFRAGWGMVDPDNPVYSDSESYIDVDSASAMTLSGAYFFSPNWSFEVLAATPFTHDVLLGVPGVGAAKIGEVEHLPPTFTLQYNFVPDAAFRPYVGLGLNWTTILSSDVVSDLSEQGYRLSVDDSVGAAFQLAADWVFSNNWLINFDFRYIMIESDASIYDPKFDEWSDPAKLKLNPFVYSINIGYTF